MYVGVEHRSKAVERVHKDFAADGAHYKKMHTPLELRLFLASVMHCG